MHCLEAPSLENLKNVLYSVSEMNIMKTTGNKLVDEILKNTSPQTRKKASDIKPLIDSVDRKWFDTWFDISTDYIGPKNGGNLVKDNEYFYQVCEKL
jgi:hypothetical protein